MTVFAGTAEFERDLIGDRTSAGRKTARRRGIQLACLRKLTSEHAKLVRRLLDDRKSVREIADTFKLHTATIYQLSATPT
jgi:DNA invertase Pin-like site-specific DNA recombinase